MGYKEPIDDTLSPVTSLKPEDERRASVYVAGYVKREHNGSHEVVKELLSMLGLIAGEELKSSRRKRS